MKRFFTVLAFSLPIALVVLAALWATGTIEFEDAAPERRGDEENLPDVPPDGPGPGDEVPDDPPPDPPDDPEPGSGDFTERSEELRKGWIIALREDWEVARRDAALEEMKKALDSGSPDEVHAALSALESVGEAVFDRRPFRPLVRRQLESANPRIRHGALYALVSLGVSPAERDAIVAMVADPSPLVRGVLADILRRHAGRRFEGAIADAVLKLLLDSDPDVVKKSIRGLGGVPVPTAIEDRLVALAFDAEEKSVRVASVTTGLALQHSKSPRMVDVLLRFLADSDEKVRRAVASGLRLGVPEEERTKVADGMTARLYDEPSGAVVSEMLRAIAAYGGRDHIQALERFAGDSGTAEGHRKAAGIAIAQIRRRLGD